MAQDTVTQEVDMSIFDNPDPVIQSPAQITETQGENVPDSSEQQTSEGAVESPVDAEASKTQETTVDATSQVDQNVPPPVQPKVPSAPVYGEIHKANLAQREFPPVPKLLRDKPSTVFDDKTYYKTCLTGENEASKRLHQMLTKFMAATDPADRTVYRQNIITAYWECLKGMATRMMYRNTPLPKRLMCRYGVLLPSLFRPEQKEFFAKFILDNPYKEPVLYLDEWLCEIAAGRMKPSMTDEKRQSIKTSDPVEAAQIAQSQLQQLQSKNSGKMQAAENVLSMKERERAKLERDFKSKSEELCVHEAIVGLEPHNQPYSEQQTKLLAEVMETLRSMSKNNRELVKALAEFKEAKMIYESVEEKITGDNVNVQANTTGVEAEFTTIRQMAKMTVGRQGNQYPIFTRDFYHCTPMGTGNRENVIQILRWIEANDPGAFCRIHKNISNRIVPYVLLIPSYGDRGFCWEPFDRYNRTTSRGRIVVPMYPRDLKVAVLTAVADLRWQVAKEKASYYWMEEGLTGQYYQHIDRLKLKGDLKAFFVEDYILWMTKESEGVQRLDKEVRGIFWRNIPFPEEKKQDLRKRSLVYDELCKKDANRAMSDGY